MVYLFHNEAENFCSNSGEAKVLCLQRQTYATSHACHYSVLRPTFGVLLMVFGSDDLGGATS